MAEFRVIEPVDVPAFWDLVAPYLASAFAHSRGDITFDDLFPLITEGDYTLWVVGDNGALVGAFLAADVRTPRMRIMEVYIGGAEKSLGIWAETFEFLKGWCAHAGYDRLVVSGRKGWSRALKPLGFTLDHVTMGVSTKGDK